MIETSAAAAPTSLEQLYFELHEPAPGAAVYFTDDPIFTYAEHPHEY